MHKLEENLIEAAQQGSVVAFEQLISPVEKKMLSLAAGLASSPDEAEDIYQEAMLSAYKGLAKFQSKSKFSTWLYRILVNAASNSRRKLKNKLSQLIVTERIDFETSINEPLYEQYTTSANPESELVNKQLSEAINKAMRSLSEQEKIAFVICHQQEFKIADAAQVMECSEGTVKSTLFRAREKMRSQLKAYLN